MFNLFSSRPTGPIDWSLLQNNERSIENYREKLDLEVREVKLLRGKNKNNMLYNHWSVHLQLASAQEVRLDMTSLAEQPVPGTNYVLGSVTRQFVKPVGGKPDQYANPLQSQYMWVYDEDQQHLVLRLKQPQAAKRKASEFLDLLRLDSLERPEIREDGTNGCADWCAKVIDLFIKRNFLLPVEGKDVFNIVRKFKGEPKDGKKNDKKGQKKGDKTNWKTCCRLDYPTPSAAT